MDKILNMSDANLYTDFSSLQRLKSQVHSQQASSSDDSVKKVAKQFESLFLQMMLKSMRDAADSIRTADDSMESDQTRFYQDMFDKQIAINLASDGNGGLGIATMLEKDLAKNQPQDMQVQAMTDNVELVRNQLNRAGALIHSETNTGQE